MMENETSLNPDKRLETAESLFGSIPTTMTLDEAREERLGKL